MRTVAETYTKPEHAGHLHEFTLRQRKKRVESPVATWDSATSPTGWGTLPKLDDYTLWPATTTPAMTSPARSPPAT